MTVKMEGSVLMKQKLDELKKKRETAQCNLDSINKEIEAIEKQMLESDANLYKGKWFYKSEDWWDEFDNCYKEYEIVHVKSVRMELGRTYLSVVIIKMTHYWKLENFNIETDNDYSLRELKEFTEMTEGVFSRMDETIKQMFECLLDIRPSLKETL